MRGSSAIPREVSFGGEDNRRGRKVMLCSSAETAPTAKDAKAVPRASRSPTCIRCAVPGGRAFRDAVSNPYITGLDSSPSHISEPPQSRQGRHVYRNRRTQHHSSAPSGRHVTRRSYRSLRMPHKNRTLTGMGQSGFCFAFGFSTSTQRAS